MTTLLLSIGLFFGGAWMLAFRYPITYALGPCCIALGLALWFGLGTLCGWSGPLSQCAVMR